VHTVQAVQEVQEDLAQEVQELVQVVTDTEAVAEMPLPPTRLQDTTELPLANTHQLLNLSMLLSPLVLTLIALWEDWPLFSTSSCKFKPAAVIIPNVFFIYAGTVGSNSYTFYLGGMIMGLSC
jgi:hypothetical protein